MIVHAWEHMETFLKLSQTIFPGRNDDVPANVGNLEAQPNLKIENEITQNLFYSVRKEKRKRVQTPW